MRLASITIAVVALILLSLWEVGLAFPVAGWLYVCIAIVFAAVLIHPEPVRHQLGRLSALAIVISLIAALYFVDWTTRKPFLRDLAKVRVGMTKGEVRRIMARYMEGTGWIWPSAEASSSSLTDLNSGSQYAMTTVRDGEFTIRDSIVFRHSTDAAFNADWGIVQFSNGKVVKIEFSPD